MPPTGATVPPPQRRRRLAVVVNLIKLDDVDAARYGWDEPSWGVTTEVEIGAQINKSQESETISETASAPRDDEEEEVFLVMTGLGLDGEFMANTGDRVKGVRRWPACVLAAACWMDRLTAARVTRGDASPSTPPRVFPARQGFGGIPPAGLRQQTGSTTWYRPRGPRFRPLVGGPGTRVLRGCGRVGYQ